MQTNFAKKFKKRYEKADAKIKTAFDKRLKLFLQNQFDPSLNNHQLTGKYSKSRSINVTGDWRAVFEESVDEEGEKQVNFKILGTHSELYR